MATATLSTLAYSLKRFYSGKMPEDVATRGQEFFRRVKKVAGMGGEENGIRYAVKYANSAGVSANFTNGQANAGNTQGVQFLAPSKKYYGFLKLDRQVLKGTKTPSMAWLDGKRQEMDGILSQVGTMLAIHLYGAGTGTLGRRASISSNTVTLTNADDVKKFFVGMTVVASSTDGAGGLRAGSTTVTQVSMSAGTITLASAAAITSFADNDYLAAQGDLDAVTMGLAGWIPLTAETSGTFFGASRFVDVERLQGWRISNTGIPLHESLKLGASQVRFANGKTSHVFMHPTNWTNVEREANSKLIRSQGGTAELGFERVVLPTPSGPIELVSDPYCPLDRAYGLDLSSFEYVYMGEESEPAIQLITDDGVSFLRGSSADEFEFRWATYGNLICRAPAHQFVVAVSTV